MDFIKNQASSIYDLFRTHPILSTFATLGIAATTKCGFNIVKTIWKYTLRPGKKLFQTYGEPKSWAIVTGGSSGIGLSYAKQLAKAGFNILLIARGAEKLEQKKNEILDTDGVPASCDVESLSFDFSKPYTEENYLPLVKALEGKDIAILVNNVGVDHACDFYKFAPDMINDMINVNVVGLTFMTWLVVPKMMGRKKRSAIINISSTFTTTTFPYFGMYIGTKGYMNSLMDCLHDELKAQKIDVLTCLTGEVKTPRNPVDSIWHATFLGGNFL